MLFINRLKAYAFSLDEIKAIMQSEEIREDRLQRAFIHKKKEIGKKVQEYSRILAQLEDDIAAIEQGENPKTVQHNLGHSDVAFTLQIYSHTYESAQKNAAMKLDETINSIKKIS